MNASAPFLFNPIECGGYSGTLGPVPAKVSGCRAADSRLHEKWWKAGTAENHHLL